MFALPLWQGIALLLVGLFIIWATRRPRRSTPARYDRNSTDYRAVRTHALEVPEPPKWLKNLGAWFGGIVAILGGINTAYDFWRNITGHGK